MGEAVGLARTVATLLGHAHVEMAVACLGSLRRYCAEPLRLRLHDDGSLTPEDRARLEAALGSPACIPRAEADERLGELLATRPACLAFRSANPLGLKLLDVPLLAEGEEVAYCDSDVLFRRPFAQLFRLPSDAGALFQSDVQDAYSVRSWQVLLAPRLRLVRRVNTGIVVMRRSAFELDLVEWFLSRREFHRSPAWVEQTAFALLGARAGCRLYDPEQIALPHEASAADPVALHFVSPLRDRLPAALREARDRQGELPSEIRTVPTARCTALCLAAGEARRRMRR